MKSTLLGIFINFALALTKCSAGLLGHSFALVADGLESSAEFHLGAKSADARGKPSGKQIFGLLRRRPLRVERITYIGRESNLLEEMEAGLIHSPESVYTEYPDPSPDEWRTRILPILKNIPIAALIRGQWQIPFDAPSSAGREE